MMWKCKQYKEMHNNNTLSQKKYQEGYEHETFKKKTMLLTFKKTWFPNKYREAYEIICLPHLF